MRKLSLVMLALAMAGALVFATYQRYPRAQTFQIDDPQYEIVQETRLMTAQAEVQGEVVDVTVQVPVERVVERTAATFQTFSPTPLQRLQFWILLFAALIYGVYAACVIGVWVRDKIRPRRASNDTRDVGKRLDGIVSFVTGALIGFLGGADFSEYPRNSPYHQPVDLQHEVNSPASTPTT